MKTLLSIEVKGNDHAWSFSFYGDPKYLDEWREDGLEINAIVNVVPAWVVDLGLTKIWIFIQDIFNFKFLKR